MICQPCQDGGKLSQGHVDFSMLAKVMHEKRKGGTWCDCQHVVGRTARAGKEPK